MNVTALIVQAADLARSSKFEELEVLCSHILKKKPKCFDALQLLGLAQVELGQVKKAIKTLEYSCEMNKNHADVRVNLANSYLRVERAKDSLNLVKEAIALDSTKFESYLIMGNALFLLKKYAESEQAYLEVLRINPDSVEAYDNLAESVKRQGRLQEAITLRFKANEICPTYTPVYGSLVNVLMYAGRREEALEVANIGLQVSGIKPKEILDLWVGIARYGWLTGNVSLMVEALNNSQGILRSDEKISDIKNLNAYHTYMTKLFQTLDAKMLFYNRDYDSLLYFISDSHSLSASNIVIDYAGNTSKIKSFLILGSKVWFLGSQIMNEFRASLAHIVASIPKGANVVLGFGEIDCRPDEGILLAYKERGIDYKQSIPNMVRAYLEYVIFLTGPVQQKVLIYGVPAPSKDVLVELDSITKELLIDIIRLFNCTLKVETNKKQLPFIDVYAATVDCGGVSNMRYHLDGYHLHPQLYPILFEEYVFESKSLLEVTTVRLKK